MVQDRQRWKCRACGYQFTRTVPRGRPLWQKSLAVFLHSQGIPLHTIGGLFHVQPSTVLKWVRQLSGHPYGEQEPGNVQMMELSDLRRQLKRTPAGQKAGTLCIAIDDATFKKSTAIRILRSESEE